MRSAFLLAFLATPLAAQDLTPGLSAQDFDAYVRGKTLTWSLGAQVWGVEEYLPRRQVQWANQPGTCQLGHWYEDKGQICFLYEGDAGAACWIFRRTAAGLTADFQGATGTLHLSETSQSDQGLPCPGPEVGT